MCYAETVLENTKLRYNAIRLHHPDVLKTTKAKLDLLRRQIGYIVKPIQSRFGDPVRSAEPEVPMMPVACPCHFSLGIVSAFMPR